MKKSLLLALLCTLSTSSYADLDWDDLDDSNTPTPIHSTFSKDEALKLNENASFLDDSTFVAGSAAAYLLSKKFSCNEYKMAARSKKAMDIVKDIKNDVIDMKEIEFKEKKGGSIEMRISYLIPALFTSKQNEVSLCNKQIYNYKCAGKKSPYISFLKIIEAKSTQLLLIERTLADKKGLEELPYSKSDSSRRLESIIICSSRE